VDVHTHPGESTSQSEVDRTHPMLSDPGHLAIILPRYAAGFALRISRMSLYEYSGNFLWKKLTGRSRKQRLYFTWF
jgi:hypothetical protein